MSRETKSKPPLWGWAIFRHIVRSLLSLETIAIAGCSTIRTLQSARVALANLQAGIRDWGFAVPFFACGGQDGWRAGFWFFCEAIAGVEAEGGGAVGPDAPVPAGACTHQFDPKRVGLKRGRHQKNEFLSEQRVSKRRLHIDTQRQICESLEQYTIPP